MKILENFAKQMGSHLLEDPADQIMLVVPLKRTNLLCLPVERARLQRMARGEESMRI